jgi:hypothetical protein
VSADVSESIFRIYSSDPNNHQWGTAFAFDWSFPKDLLAIASRQEATYLLTAKHVITDVGGADKVRVGRYPGYSARLVFSEPDGGPDNLVVLRIDDLRDVPHLTLADIGKTDDEVRIYGFRSFSEGLLVRPLRARLGEQVSLQSQQDPRRVKGWDLRIEADYDLERGYSGGPVIQNESGLVVAVASHREGGRKGVAISSNVLYEAWPGVLDSMGFSIFDHFLLNLVAPPPQRLVDARTLRSFEVHGGARFSAISTSSDTHPGELGGTATDSQINALIETENVGRWAIEPLVKKLYSSVDALGFKYSFFGLWGAISFDVFLLFLKGYPSEVRKLIKKKSRQIQDDAFSGWLGVPSRHVLKGRELRFRVLDFEEQRAYRYYEGKESRLEDLETSMATLLSRYPLG